MAYVKGYKTMYGTFDSATSRAPVHILPSGYQMWEVDGEDISDKVSSWINYNNYPDYTLWDNAIKHEFLVRFCVELEPYVNSKEFCDFYKKNVVAVDNWINEQSYPPCDKWDADVICHFKLEFFHN